MLAKFVLGEQIWPAIHEVATTEQHCLRRHVCLAANIVELLLRGPLKLVYCVNVYKYSLASQLGQSSESEQDWELSEFQTGISFNESKWALWLVSSFIGLVCERQLWGILPNPFVRKHMASASKKLRFLPLPTAPIHFLFSYSSNLRWLPLVAET